MFGIFAAQRQQRKQAKSFSFPVHTHASWRERCILERVLTAAVSVLLSPLRAGKGAKQHQGHPAL